MKFVLNFGGGVNSTALAIELVRRKEPLDLILFADTGNELPETCDFIEKSMVPWFKKNGLEFKRVAAQTAPLYDYYFKHRSIPFRKIRDCTDKFKVSPMRIVTKEFRKEGLTRYIGIALEERHRAEGMDKNNPKYAKTRYPLIEWGIDRNRCMEIIRSEGLPVPPKSGCFMCPFQPTSSWINLFKTHPELFEKALKMEKQNRTYPKNTLVWKGTLESLKNAIKSQSSLDQFDYSRACGGFDHESDCRGYCMT